MPGLFYAQTVDEGSPPSAPIQNIRHASDHLRDSTKMVMHKSRGFSFAPHRAIEFSAKAAYAA
jgi:hypothetical protein